MSTFPLRRRREIRNTAAVSVAVACAATGVAQESADSGRLYAQFNQIGGSNEVPEILRLEGGELISRRFNRHHLSLSYRPAFNVGVEFGNLGFPATSLPGPGGGLADRDYDDGYVRPETSGAAAGSPDGYTSNWAYESVDQVVGNSLLMHKAVSSGVTGSIDAADDGPMQGMEFEYAFAIGPIGHVMWGVEAAIGYGGFNARDSRSLSASIDVITDTFDVSNLEAGGGPPPPPGTSSTERSGTSALILVDPVSRTTDTYSGWSIDGFREVDVDVLDFRLGPYLEFSLLEQLRLTLGGGIAFANVDSSFAFSENLLLPGGSLTNSGRVSRTKTLVGGYVSADLAWQFSESWQAFAGLQYRNLGKFDQTVNGAEVRLDFSSVFYAALGIGYSF